MLASLNQYIEKEQVKSRFHYNQVLRSNLNKIFSNQDILETK